MTGDGVLVVRSDACLRHVPGAEIWVGVRTPGTEVAERATRIETALRDAGHRVVEAAPHDDDVLLRVHDPRLVEHLRTVYDRWVEAGFPEEPGQDRVVPYLIPSAGMLDGLPEREPVAVHAAAGRWCYDTMTLVGPRRYAAARAAASPSTRSAMSCMPAMPAMPVIRPPVRPPSPILHPSPAPRARERRAGSSCRLAPGPCSTQAL